MPTTTIRHGLLGLVAASLLCSMTLLLPGTARAADSPPRSFGVSQPSAPGDLGGIEALSTSVGRSPDLVMWYAAWATVADFPAAEAARVAATGALPEITWEPWRPGAGVTQSAYTLTRIATGRHDTYLKRWARQARAYGRPVVLRLAHEMNGSWYPWAEGVNGNRPGEYVAAWRHVVDVFRAQGATNVQWSWSPNVPYPGSVPLAGLFPGDAYLDRVALDGYNWGGVTAGSSWQSFWQVFGPGVGEVRGLSARPLHLGEVGCAEVGGDKAAWVADMFATLAAHPEVRGFTWFDHLKEADWRIASSAGSLDAFRVGLAGYGATAAATAV